ncbi:MAG: nitroreductase family protein [Pseudomarimonas sp.]
MTHIVSEPQVDSLHFLNQRRSCPSRLLGEPGPDADTVDRWLRAAVRVPDHGKLSPWRFLLIRGEARLRLGEKLAHTLESRDSTTSEAALAKERARFANAPLIVAVIGRLVQGHKVPVCEQLLSAGCVCYSLLLAASADGFAGQWLTGWAAYDTTIAAALGLATDEAVVGFIHVGTPREMPAERERPRIEDRVAEWQG